MSKNASSPVISPFAAASSKISMPRSSVTPKRSSSAASTRWISSRRSTTSGYACPICSITTSARPGRNGDFIPIRKPCCAARRMIRRRTYSRPSFEGATPSAAMNVMPRPWSASTRCAFVASCDEPYATPDCSATQSMISW